MYVYVWACVCKDWNWSVYMYVHVHKQTDVVHVQYKVTPRDEDGTTSEREWSEDNREGGLVEA